MAQQLRELAQTDFSGGMNAVASPYAVGQRQVVTATNLLLDEHGSLSVRPGYAILASAPDLTRAIRYRGVLNTAGGNRFEYAIQATATVPTLYRTDTTPWTSIGSFTTNETLPQSITVVDQELIAHGYETPKLYNGSTLTAITAAGGETVPPGAKHAAFHLGAVWLWNTKATNTTLDGPSSLRASTPGSDGATGGSVVTAWPDASQAFIGKDDGQVGMGMSTFTIVETGISPTATLVLFKNYSGYQVTGTFGASTFSIQKIKSDMGCVAPRTIQFVSGYGLIRLTHKGFALYNGVDDRLISEEVRPYIFGHDDVAGLNAATLERSWAVQCQNPPLYIAACPTTSSGALNRVFVYDLVRRAWTLCTFPVDFASLMLMTSTSMTPTINAGTTAGQIVRIFGTDATDAGDLIAWSFKTRSFYLGSPMRPSFWRRFCLDVEPTSGTLNRTATITTTLGGFVSTLASTATFKAATASRIPVRQTIEIIRTAPTVHATVAGSSEYHQHIRGVAFQGSPKPITRVVR